MKEIQITKRLLYLLILLSIIAVATSCRTTKSTSSHKEQQKKETILKKDTATSFTETWTEEVEEHTPVLRDYADTSVVLVQERGPVIKKITRRTYSRQKQSKKAEFEVYSEIKASEKQKETEKIPPPIVPFPWWVWIVAIGAIALWVRSLRKN